jgi:hypothetical protein
MQSPEMTGAPEAVLRKAKFEAAFHRPGLSSPRDLAVAYVS